MPLFRLEGDGADARLVVAREKDTERKRRDYRHRDSECKQMAGAPAPALQKRLAANPNAACLHRFLCFFGCRPIEIAGESVRQGGIAAREIDSFLG